MKFLVDENEFRHVLSPLQGLFPTYEFHHVTDLNITGMKDEELFDWMAVRAYTGIITKDANQLVDRRERAKLMNRELHWIGRKHDALTGLKMFASAVATYLSAFPFITESITGSDELMMYQVKNLPIQVGQRVKISPLAP